MNVHCSRNRLDAVYTKLSRMNAEQKNSSLTPKSQQTPQVAMMHKMRVFVMWRLF